MNDGPSVARETEPRQKTEVLLEGLYVLYNTINGRSYVKPSLYQPKSGIVVTITLEFLDKYMGYCSFTSYIYLIIVCSQGRVS
jgi:hypothetical protein